MRSSEILKKFERKCCKCKRIGSYNLIIQSRFLKRDKRICLSCWEKKRESEKGK